MNKFTQGNLSELAGYKLPCTCGSLHSTEYSNIIFESGAINKLLSVTKEIIPQGKILLVVDNQAQKELLLGVQNILQSNGFNIFTHMLTVDYVTMQSCAEFFNYPEDIRLLISLGGDNAINAGRYFSFVGDIKHIVVVGDYSSVYAFSSISRLYVNGLLRNLDTKCSHTIIYDLDFLQSPSKQQIANLFGFVSSHYLCVFDSMFAHSVDNEKYCENAILMLDSLFARVSEVSSGLVRGDLQSVILFLESAIRVMIVMQSLSEVVCNISCESVSRTLISLQIASHSSLRHVGEVLFFAAKKLIKIYELFLKNHIRDLGFPPNKGLRADKIFQLFGGVKKDILQDFDYDECIKKYDLRLLRLEEYRTDLLSSLNLQAEKIFDSAKTFRRLSSDLGYSLQKTFSLQDVKSAISISPDFEKKFSVLTVMRDMGLLDSYLT